MRLGMERPPFRFVAEQDSELGNLKVISRVKMRL